MEQGVTHLNSRNLATLDNNTMSQYMSKQHPMIWTWQHVELTWHRSSSSGQQMDLEGSCPSQMLMMIDSFPEMTSSTPKPETGVWERRRAQILVIKLHTVESWFHEITPQNTLIRQTGHAVLAKLLYFSIGRYLHSSQSLFVIFSKWFSGLVAINSIIFLKFRELKASLFDSEVANALIITSDGYVNKEPIAQWSLLSSSVSHCL